MSWTVIAGDGSGVVTAAIDPRGGTSFTFSTNLNGNAPSVGGYVFGLTVPTGLNCTSAANSRCTMQVKSSSGWVSCFSFIVGNFPSQTSTTSKSAIRTSMSITHFHVVEEEKTCTTVGANQMGFCTSLNDRQVMLSRSKSLALQDSIISSYYNSIYNNTNVFTNGITSETCRLRLKHYLCHVEMPLCGTSSSSQGMSQCYCEDTMKECGLTESHQNLFNCSALPTCARSNTSWADRRYGVTFLNLVAFLLAALMVH